MSGHDRRRRSPAGRPLPGRALALFLLLFLSLAPGIAAGGSSAADSCATKQDPIGWLACQVDSSPDLDPGPGVARLVNSREGGPWDGVSWLFDQAQAVIAFAVARDTDRARQLLDALSRLQVVDGGPDDGSWCTSYYLDGVCRDPTRRSGSTAWVVIAVNYYEWVEEDPTYAEMADRTLRYLEGLVNDDPSSEEFGAVALGPDRWWIYASEHQEDGVSAFLNRYLLRGGEPRREVAERMRSFLAGRMDFGPCAASDDWKVWLGVTEDVFNAGGACTAAEYYACPQTFGALTLGPPRASEPDYLVALDSIWEGGPVDMSLSDVYERPADYTEGPDDVVVEGLDLGTGPTGTGHVYFIGEATSGLAAADFLYGDGTRGAFLMAETAKVLYPDGGVPYCTDPADDRHKAVASTAWFYFNSLDPRVNPMNPADYEVGASLSVRDEPGGVRLDWSPVPAAGPVVYDVFRGPSPDALAVIDRTGATSYLDDSPPAEAYYGVSLRRTGGP